jgi:hypothetical protein
MSKLKNISVAFVKSILLTFGFVITAILVTKLFSILAPLLLNEVFRKTYTMTDIAATTIKTTYPQIIILIIGYTNMFYYTKKLKSK